MRLPIAIAFITLATALAPAEGAFDSLLSQVPDYPVDDQDELFAKALYPLSNKTGPFSLFPLARVSQK